MGKEIVYCGDCGTSLREEDFSKGRAHEVENRPYCTSCRPLPTAPEPVPFKKKPSSGTHARIGTTRRASTAASAGKGPLIGGAAGGVVLLAVAGALASRPSDAPAPPVAAPAAARVPATPSSPSAPSAPSVTAPSAPPTALPDPAVTLERWLNDVRVIRRRDSEFARAGEVRSLLRQAIEIAGPRKAEVEAILADYEREIAAPRAAPPPPAPAPAPKPSPPPAPKPSAKAPVVVSFTLIDAVKDKPVPGFDPIPPDAVIDAAKLGLTLIDIRANLDPKQAGTVEGILDGGKPHFERGWPYSCTSNGADGKYDGFKAVPGKHTASFTAWSGSDKTGAKGPTAVCRFEVK